MRLKALLLPLIAVFLSTGLMAQLDTRHWIPPFFALLEDSSNQQNIRKHFVSLSTPAEDTIPVVIRDGFGTLIDTVMISKEMPMEYIFGPLGMANGDSTTVFPLNVVPRDSLNTPIRSQGLYFESFQPFFVNMRHKSGSQGMSLTSKGQVGLGTRFYSGHLYTIYNNDSTWNNNRRSHFISVMATEDSTTVTFDLIKDPIVYIGQTPGEPISVTLDAFESYVLGVDHEDYDNLTINNANGTRITSDKPIVCNSGSWLSGNQSGQCIGADQLAPASVTGQEYVLVKGLGDETTERPMVVATDDGTEVFVNDETEPIAILDEGEFHFIATDKFTANENLYILTTEKVFVFQTASGSSTNIGPTVGLNFIPPLNCVGAKEVNLPFVNSLSSGGEGRINIITKTGTNIFINDEVTPLTGAQTVTGNPDWVSYAFDPPSDNVNIVSDSVMNVALLTRDNVVGTAGYFSGFTLEPVVGISAGISGSLPCIPGNATLQVFGFDTYQWYFNGDPIEGATSNTLFPEFAGQYSVEGIDLACGFVFPSKPFDIPFCPSTLGAAKQVQAIEETEPGSRIFDITYRIFIQNISPATSLNLQIIENIQGGLPSGATAELIGEPSLVFGILTGGLNENFDGVDDRKLLPGTGSLPGAESDAIDLTIRVDMNNAVQDGYFNQVTVTSADEGVNDGVTGPFNAQDFSNDGSDPDPDGDDEPNEEGENTPTLTCFFPNTFEYASASFCVSDEEQEITLEGVSSGVFSSDTEGLALNDTTGIINPQASEAGTYTVTFTVEGRCPTVTSTEVTIVDAPSAGSDIATDVCETTEEVDLELLLEGEQEGGLWTDTNGNEVGSVFEPAEEGTFAFTYTISVDPCPSEQATVTVNIIGEPNPGEPTEDVDYCFDQGQADLQDLLTGNDPNGVWTDPDGEVLEETFEFDQPGIVELTYTVSNETCGDRSVTVPLNIVALPDPGVSLGTEAICEGVEVNLNDLLNEADGDGDWFDEDGNLIEDIIVLEGSGEQTYVYTIDRAPCPSVSSEVVIDVIDGPSAGTPVDDPVELCPNDPSQNLFGLLDGADPQGDWTDENGNEVVGIFNPEDEGSFEYTYTVSSPECGDVMTVLVLEVDEEYCTTPIVFDIPEGFSPNGDGKNDLWQITGLLELYPDNSLQIFNRWGGEVLSASPYTNDWDGESETGLNAGEVLPVGTYWYILDLGDGNEPKKGFIYLTR